MLTGVSTSDLNLDVRVQRPVRIPGGRVRTFVFEEPAARVGGVPDAQDSLRHAY